jgi:hypothetical protein
LVAGFFVRIFSVVKTISGDLVAQSGEKFVAKRRHHFKWNDEEQGEDEGQKIKATRQAAFVDYEVGIAEEAAHLRPLEVRETGYRHLLVLVTAVFSGFLRLFGAHAPVHAALGVCVELFPQLGVESSRGHFVLDVFFYVGGNALQDALRDELGQ